MQGHADAGGGPLPHLVAFTVTDLVKVINGVRSVVVYETDVQNGKIVAGRLAFFAQDTAGNVWSFGEYPEEYEDEMFVRAPDVWVAGIGDAQGGIEVKASPQSGVAWYLQGSVPSTDSLTCGRVSMTDARACVPITCFTDVMVTEWTNPLNPDSGIQLKYSARGVGYIQTGAAGGQEGESLQLVEHRTLDAAELAGARTAALTLERRAYESSPIYKQTQPISAARK